MDVSGLLAWFNALEPYRTLRTDLESGEMPSSLGLLRAVRPALLAALACDLKRPLLVIAGSVERAKGLASSMRDWSPAPECIWHFPEPLALFYERVPWTDEVIAGRLRVISTLYARRPPNSASSRCEVEEKQGLIVFTSARALMQRTLPLHQFRTAIRELHAGEVLDLEQTLSRWMGAGYEPTSVVESPGQFSHRGGILDIFPPAAPTPVRIELFGSQIESLRRFDPATQRSQERVESVTITPAREPLPRHGPRIADHVAAQLASDQPADVRAELEAHHQSLLAAAPFPGLEFYLPYLYTESATLLDYLPSEALLVVDDPQELSDVWAGLEEEAVNLRATAEEGGALPPDYPLPYVTWDEWAEQLADRAALALGHGEEGAVSRLADCFTPGPHFGGQLRPVLEHIHTAQTTGAQVVVVSQQARRLAELWGEEHEYLPPVEELRQPPQAPLSFVRGPLAEGWILKVRDQGSGIGDRGDQGLGTKDQRPLSPDSHAVDDRDHAEPREPVAGPAVEHDATVRVEHDRGVACLRQADLVETRDDRHVPLRCDRRQNRAAGREVAAAHAHLRPTRSGVPSSKMSARVWTRHPGVCPGGNQMPCRHVSRV